MFFYKELGPEDMFEDVVTGDYMRTLVTQMETENKFIAILLLKTKLATTGTGDINLTATGNVYNQEVRTLNASNVPVYSYQSSFSNTNSVKRATCFRATNGTSKTYSVVFQDYNVPSTPSITRTVNPGDHYFLIIRPLTPLSAGQSGATSIIAWTNTTTGQTGQVPKAPNANVLNWDGLSTIPQETFV